ncbi:inactive hydroxysteroid dehydrogenase-like protein 1 [Lingula anatina]|uniref:Inactive hydroxysteroid dehydrogenase-like protein 1 n=1 Tax=Lingula anatina TaxID=7574 RepID=A0A1S3J2E8_LINAN|nr:inactive hydroxysteroid dehydrogenase-like protein 1 [Lingula anatina]|eukprot:XP_013404575.1 inactive hydroxysteroid dehydrogenase-like protein 1 [Lingula anatina]
MAAVVDSFSFLAKEIISVLTSFRDALALIGAIYAARKTLGLSYKVVSAIRFVLYTKFGRRDLVRYGHWAVVTGCTHGIGKAYAYELASGGLNIILVSRGLKKLQEVAKDIEESFGVQTCIVPVDFNEADDAYPGIQSKIQDKEVGILVNNVGVMYDYPQFFLDVQPERLWQLVNVNVAAATMMTHLVLPQMVARGRGVVVNMSSSACFLPTPQMTVYSATKAYLDCFSRALQVEYKDRGIIVQCLMPWYVATRMTQYSETLSDPSTLIPSAQVYARNAVATIGFSSRTTGYWPHSILSWFCSYIPESLWMWFSMRLNNALRQQAHRRIKMKKLKHSESLSSFSDEDLAQQSKQD